MRFAFLQLIFLFFLLLGTFLPEQSALAQNQPDPCLNSQFGCLEVIGDLLGINNQPIDKYVEGETAPTVKLINRIVKIVTGLVVIMGVIGVVVAGYLYMTAGGNGARLTTSKAMIASALFGIALALTSWIILNTISSQFTSQVQDPKQLLPRK